MPTQSQFSALVSGQGQGAFRFLTANGLQWQQDGPTVKVNNVSITAPAYWSSGGTTVDFAIDFALHLYDQNDWPFFLPDGSPCDPSGSADRGEAPTPEGVTPGVGAACAFVVASSSARTSWVVHHGL